MDLISAKHDAPDDNTTFLEKLHEQIQKMMDRTAVIPPPMDLSHLPYPLPPFKPDDVNFEKLDWIIPPIPVKPEDECRKENYNDTCDQKE
jgi:hypothetical protein